MIIRFRSSEDHEDLLKKVKKMKKFTQEIEDCLEDAMYDDDLDFREEDGHHSDWEDSEMKRGRYNYRKMMRR